MNELLAQIILARRDSDVENWINILVVVLIAIGYALSSIFKARVRKVEDKDEEELAGRKPASKPPAGSRALQEQSLKQARRPVAHAPGRQYRPAVQRQRASTAVRRAVEKFITEAEELSRLAAIEPLAEPKLGIPTPQLEPQLQELPELDTKIEELPQFTREAVKELGGRHGDIPAEMPGADYLPEILSDYADPDELRRAILHYEILGRPLSLRDPSGRIIGL
jgi:hypothetical protein